MVSKHGSPRPSVTSVTLIRSPALPSSQAPDSAGTARPHPGPCSQDSSPQGRPLPRPRSPLHTLVPVSQPETAPPPKSGFPTQLGSYSSRASSGWDSRALQVTLVPCRSQGRRTHRALGHRHSYFQGVTICPPRGPVPSGCHSLAPPPAPGNQSSYFCLYGFACSGHFSINGITFLVIFLLFYFIN